MANTKSKYLKTLGFFNNFSTSLGTIPESLNEYNDEVLKKNSNKNNTVSGQSFSSEDVRDLIMTAVKNNNLQQLKELLEQYDDYDINSLGNNGWTALHFACLNGFTEIALELVSNNKADVNLENIDHWTPLHLSSYKGHLEIVKMLLSNPETNINSNKQGIGTPLHCACKKNHLPVVSILLHRADFR